MRKSAALISCMQCMSFFVLASAEDMMEEPEECSLLQRVRMPTFSVDSVTVGENGRKVGYKVLRNVVTNESADVAYTFGGKVDSIRLKSPVSGNVREMVLSSGRDAEKFLTMGWAVGEMLAPFANRIKNGTYELNHSKYYMKRNLPPNAIHGFLGGKEMRVVRESANSSAASVTLAYDFNDPGNPESQPQGYPFLLSMEVTYTLDSSGFSVTTLARNRAESGGPLPFYMGMHPYFAVQDLSKTFVLLDQCTGWNRILIDDALIPTTAIEPFHGFSGEPLGGTKEDPAPWDAGFKATATHYDCPVLKTEVYDPTVGDSSVLWMNSADFKWVQVFTNGAKYLGQVVAIEPMSGETDAFNNHEADLLLQAGQRWQGMFGFRIEAPSEKLTNQETY